MKKNRLILIDILRILFMLFIFLRHSATMGGCKYTLFTTDVLKQINRNVLSGFFILSGFSLYYVYHDKVLLDIKNLLSFYRKRFISLLPIYFLVIFCYFLFLDSRLLTNIGLFPIEITGLHSAFANTETYLHNGTTWFVSCLIISIILFPLLKEIINNLSRKKRIVIFAIFLVVLCYLPIMFSTFSITRTYYNPLFRFMEFSLGVMLCSIIKFPNSNSKNKFIFIGFIIGLLLLLIGSYYGNSTIFTILKYVFVLFPVFFAALFVSNENKKYRLIKFLVSLSYPFYILQIFIWTDNKWLNGLVRSIKNNDLRIFVFFMILFTLSVIVVYLFQKPIEKYLKNHKIKDFFTKKRIIILCILSVLLIGFLGWKRYYAIGDKLEISLNNENSIIDVRNFTITGSTSSDKVTVYLNDKKIDRFDVKSGNFEYKINPELLNYGWNYIKFGTTRFLNINEKYAGGAINNIKDQPDVFIPDLIISIAREFNKKNRDSYYLDDDYDYNKNYIGAGNLQEGLPFYYDDKGFPMVKINEKIVYQPVFVSAYALNVYKEYLENKNEKSKKEFIKMADWFVTNHKNGALEYPFDWNVATIELKRGWTSSMAQGRALSVLARAYYLTNNQKYLKAGKSILNFMITSADKNVKNGTKKNISDFTNNYEELKKYNDYEILETYVARENSYVLNGNLFALIGLYDWYRIGNDDYGSNKAYDHFKSGIKTIEVLLPYYDYYGWTSYGLNQYSNSDYINLGNKYAHRCHLQLLYILYTKTKSETIKKYVDIFHNYYEDDFWIQSEKFYYD